MKKFALIAAVAAATVAAPAFAQSNSSAVAIAHFNMSADNISESITLRPRGNTTVVSTRGASPLSTAFAILNRSADNVQDLRGQNGATVISGTPAFGADIFARLRAASLEDE